MKELFPLLEPVFFWLANTLEFYNFLISHGGSFHLPPDADHLDHSPSAGGEEGEDEKEEREGPGEENPVTTLYNILVYAYQQAFYPVSKVKIDRPPCS